MKTKKTRPDWIVGVIITLFFIFIIITGLFDFTKPIERKAFDLRAKMAAPTERNPDIELVVISDEDLTEFGRWPWPRHIMARCIHNLSQAGARVIALNIILSEPEESSGLLAVTELRKNYENMGLAQGEAGLAFYRQLTQAIQDLDNDASLLQAIEEAGNVVLPVHFDISSRDRDREPPEFIRRHAFRQGHGEGNSDSMASLLRANKINPILPALAEATAGMGHFNIFPDHDGSLRSLYHVLRYLEDIYFPSFAVAIVKTYQDLKAADIHLDPGLNLNLRFSPSTVIQIPATGPGMSTLIRWKAGPDIAFRHTPISRVYQNQIQPEVFKDKIIIIGLTAAGTGDRFVTPVFDQMPGVEVIASSVANILNQSFVSRPIWTRPVELVLLLTVGFYISFLLPRLRAVPGALITSLLFSAWASVGVLLFFTSSVWLQITPAMLLLLMGYILVVSQTVFVSARTGSEVEADSVEANKMLGLSFQQQGLLDLAFEKFQRIPLKEKGAKDLIYNLGLGFERKRQFSKALAAYNLITLDGRQFKDLDQRIPRLRNSESSMIFETSPGSPPGDISGNLSGGEASSTLGRYRINGELGRGAMGVVYRGEDPKIHRTVAIKTVSLAEFDPEVLEEVKERFFREAESAGLLVHPNIVTIYDCGEEHDLAYIAMEYLKGTDLGEFTKRGRLLPVRESLSVIARVAGALDYAHSKGIVHRDIKPANIMYLKETKEVKVMDFGIARITASSKTKTGVVLGTPFYMSPEQIAGKKVDGRSDIFSLGMVLFELLTGQKPFQGRDFTSLMYLIAKEKHPSIKQINPRLPRVVEKIIDKALEKDVEQRYQKAGQMAAHLKQVLAKIDEVQARRGGQYNGYIA